MYSFVEALTIYVHVEEEEENYRAIYLRPKLIPCRDLTLQTQCRELVRQLQTQICPKVDENARICTIAVPLSTATVQILIVRQELVCESEHNMFSPPIIPEHGQFVLTLLRPNSSSEHHQQAPKGEKWIGGNE
jgi:hypothetical protein